MDKKKIGIAIGCAAVIVVIAICAVTFGGKKADVQEHAAMLETAATAEPAATPEVTAAPVPTEAPTATPEPTAEPTATPEPTAAHTPVVTAAPQPVVTAAPSPHSRSRAAMMVEKCRIGMMIVGQVMMMKLLVGMA